MGKLALWQGREIPRVVQSGFAVGGGWRGGAALRDQGVFLLGKIGWSTAPLHLKVNGTIDIIAVINDYNETNLKGGKLLTISYTENPQNGIEKNTV